MPNQGPVVSSQEVLSRSMMTPPCPDTLAFLRCPCKCVDGRFELVDCGASAEHRAAVRVGVGHASREWPLALGAFFSSGNSVFEVLHVALLLHFRHFGPVLGFSLHLLF
jgi:hypothetical protein